MIAALAGSSPAGTPAGPVISDTGFEAESFGAAQGYKVPASAFDFAQDHMVGYYSHYEQLRRLRRVARAGTPSTLLRNAREILPRYAYNGSTRTILDYLGRNPVTGLLIARGNTILFEHYNYARTDRDRFLSQSMVKTITGLLVGIAVSEGAIRSIDDAVAVYVPELAGTAYGKTPLRALLHMSSGIAYHETYQPGDDSTKMGFALLGRGVVAAVSQFNNRDAPAGTRWNYSSADTEVLGLVVSRAVHMTLADYLSTRIWTKMGMEADAGWDVDRTGQEIAYCCFVATLRDWARLGLMLAHHGVWNGQQIMPKQWLIDSTSFTPETSYLSGGELFNFWGYGYQVWIHPGRRPMFAFAGIHGQWLFVDPDAELVMVQTAVFAPAAGDALLEAVALWDAVVAEYGNP
jgi:CubicO group peptidase (beta-lactamase class C family)